MLSKFDDYPIQQTCEPIAYLATSERNAYGRYWFNGFHPDGDYYFGVALAVYPNREVMDCALSLVKKNGEQHSFRASRRMRGDRTDMRVGPFTLSIAEPMRTVRVTIDDNSTGITADLTFYANSPAHEEPLDKMLQGVRTVMQSTRYTQFDMWGGYIDVKGDRTEINKTVCYGTRDRSWGWRWTGEPEQGVSRQIPEQVFWLWAPIQFKNYATHYGLFEYANGKRWKQFAHIFPLHPIESDFDTLSVEGFRDVVPGEHRLTFQKGSRFAGPSEIDLIEDGKTETIKMEPLLRFHMMGIGYHHESWGHGFYKGEEEITSEFWNINDLDPVATQYQHMQVVVRATKGDEVGHGVLEQAIFGPHDRYKLTGFLDPV